MEGPLNTGTREGFSNIAHTSTLWRGGVLSLVHATIRRWEGHPTLVHTCFATGERDGVPASLQVSMG